jgi:pyochelin synthetase
VSHLDVLRELEERGLRLSLSGADLRLEGPPQRVDAELVGRIRSAKAQLVAHLTALEREQEQGFALTLLQRAYLIGRGGSVEIGNVASHIYHEVDGCWDVDALQAALRGVVARHGMLRTRFTADGTQVEEPSADVRIDRLDLRGEPPAAQQATLLALREQRSHAVLPADRAPMLEVSVTLLPGDRMRLHVGHDGLVMDGISMFLFFAEWWRGYDGDSPPADDQASFADYVAALGAMADQAPARRSREYWLDRLADLPPRPALALATSPAAITRPRYTQYAVRLDPPAWSELKARAADAGLTATGVLLAAYAETLARWGAGPRFTLTTTVAHRPPIHPRIADAIGNFSQTLLVEIDLDRRRTFEQRARALQTRLRRDLDHRHFSGIEVLRELARRDGGADARMPFTFNSTIGYVRSDIDGSAVELFGPEVYTSSQTPQVWLNAFAFEQHGGVIVQLDAVDGLFPDGMIAALAGGYQAILDSLRAEQAWSATTFDLLPHDQLERRRAANATEEPLPDGLLTDAFLRHAALQPDAPAILTAAGSVSYGELLRRASHAAGWLAERQVGRDELVGLIMRRGPEQVVGILATLLAGGAYLPADAGLPAERVAYMLRDGQVRCVLTNVSGPDYGVETLVLDAAGAPGGGPLAGAGLDDLAYVLYTSGTTGEPKGVMVSQRSVVNVVADCNARFGVTAADRFMAISAFSFDLSVYDVFGALSAGAALVLPDADRAADPAHWLDLCERFGVTIWNSVPAIAGLLQDQAREEEEQGRLGALRLVMLSGDRIPPPLPAALRRVRPGVTLVSLGGPTETTIWNILHPIDGADDGQSIPYGRPNANNRAYILDADGLDAPDWVTGEICAAGTGLARGYWRDEARTAARFFWSRGERLYRTGDLGHYRPDGSIAIAGRSDFQVKINGYRIEAGEVESRLTAIPMVKQAVVAAQAAAHGDRLVAHLVAAGDVRPAEEEIRRALRAHLPDYMMPSAIVWHESLPLTANGKVDRRKLTALAPTGPAAAGPAKGAARTGETTELEHGIIGLWAGVLRVPAESIGPGSNFYDLGGDSLAAARVFTGVRKQFGVSITLDRLHDVRTVETMAACVEAGLAARPRASAAAGAGAGAP